MARMGEELRKAVVDGRRCRRRPSGRRSARSTPCRERRRTARHGGGTSQGRPGHAGLLLEPAKRARCPTAATLPARRLRAGPRQSLPSPALGPVRRSRPPGSRYTQPHAAQAPETSSSSTSTRSPTAGRAWRVSTASWCSCAAPCPATACAPGSPGARRATPRRALRSSSRPPSCACAGVRARRELRRLRVADPRLRGAARVQAAAGGRVAARTSAGSTDFVVEPIRGMAEPWRYRNKMEFSFGATRTAARARAASARLVARDRRGRRLPAGLGAHRRGAAGGGDACRALGLRALLAATARGPAAPPGGARGRASGDLLINLFVARRFPEERSWRSAWRDQRLHHVRGHREPSPADAAVGDGPVMLSARPSCAKSWPACRCACRPPPSCRPTATCATCSTRWPCASPSPTASHAVYDLYCGIGALTPAAGAAARHVHAVEIQEEAIAAARENAASTTSPT